MGDAGALLQLAANDGGRYYEGDGFTSYGGRNGWYGDRFPYGNRFGYNYGNFGGVYGAPQVDRCVLNCGLTCNQPVLSQYERSSCMLRCMNVTGCNGRRPTGYGIFDNVYLSNNARYPLLGL